MRGNWSVKCLESQGKRLVTRADTVDPISTGVDFGGWVETLLVVAEVNNISKNTYSRRTWQKP